ncbi:oligosaccharide flippase family protein, partial [Providencia rettgeri]|nr:oligosaccharide flippase family protein [Providencia rettgeri]
MNIFKGTIVYSISSLFIKFGAFLLLPIITRLLSSSEFGIVGIYLSAYGVLSIIFGLGVYMPLMKTQAEFGEKSYEYGKKSFNSILLLILIYFLVIILFLLTLQKDEFISYLNSNNISPKMIFFSIIASMISAINVIMNTYFRMKGSFYYIAIVTLTTFIIFYGLTILLIKYLSLGVYGYIYGHISSISFMMFLYGIQ